MAAYFRTLDIAVNKLLKDYLVLEINDYIENRMVRNPRGNFEKPKLQKVVTWEKNAKDEITEGYVVNVLPG
ncbi:HTH CENPB-type domain-containing protein [Trichonephila inaurata madagascariensis]|uniref:HTH CENPB-type domain-containing protein n=1 Tax=Trichonephila inaurata madagascariensis TaxID=2747483 RepID=A0A8X6XFJ4_9ARAC|nr:HTH CENPB-type domain-containing protein [Trichonephila inaurata madagascariensis]